MQGRQGGRGTTVGILPGLDRAAANPFVDVAIATGLGEAATRSSCAPRTPLIAVGGGYGTLSEIALALKAGKRVGGARHVGRRGRGRGRSPSPPSRRRARLAIDSPAMSARPTRPTSTRCGLRRARPGRFHVPGHKGGAGADPGLVEALGERALALDIPALT